jgi:hypothetical protein
MQTTKTRITRGEPAAALVVGGIGGMRAALDRPTPD